MPGALYPKQRKPNYATRYSSGPFDSKEKQIKSHLLCFGCEQRFDRNGESEVLYWTNPKGKQSRLAERLGVALGATTTRQTEINPFIATPAVTSEPTWTSSHTLQSVLFGAVRYAIG